MFIKIINYKIYFYVGTCLTMTFYSVLQKCRIQLICRSFIDVDRQNTRILLFSILFICWETSNVPILKI